MPQVAKEAGDELGWTIVGGFVAPSDPATVDLANGIHWGAGLAYPTRRTFRLVLELHGERYTDTSVGAPSQRLPYGSVEVPAANPQPSPANVNVGVTWLNRSHVFFGAAL